MAELPTFGFSLVAPSTTSHLPAACSAQRPSLIALGLTSFLGWVVVVAPLPVDLPPSVADDLGASVLTVQAAIPEISSCGHGVRAVAASA